MRTRKVITIAELANYFKQHRDVIAHEVDEQRVDLHKVQHVLDYVISKHGEAIHVEQQIAGLVKSN